VAAIVAAVGAIAVVAFVFAIAVARWSVSGRPLVAVPHCRAVGTLGAFSWGFSHCLCGAMGREDGREGWRWWRKRSEVREEEKREVKIVMGRGLL